MPAIVASIRLVSAITITTAMLRFPVAAQGQRTGQAHDSTDAHTAGTGMAGMADAAMAMGHGMNASEAKHMLLTPARAPTHDDSVTARALAAVVRQAIARYQDTSAAVAAGYHMFLPGVKNQRVYHFTNYAHAFGEAFRFDAAKPTSLLYTRAADGSFRLLGAMYTAPKRWTPERLDARIPLSIARWHRHVNWCMPKRGEQDRWVERRDGTPVFGPASPIATREACDAVGGTFLPSVFGWMVHVNVFAGEDLGSVFRDVH